MLLLVPLIAGSSGCRDPEPSGGGTTDSSTGGDTTVGTTLGSESGADDTAASGESFTLSDGTVVVVDGPAVSIVRDGREVFATSADAFPTVRTYEESWMGGLGIWEFDRTNEDAVELLSKGRGAHFDPELVDLFLGSMDEVLEIKSQYMD